MLSTIKKRLYFVVAWYFAIWARLVLRRWQPRIVLITGSSGKTTALQLVEAQVGDKALYSHHANSALGIPFHILGLPTNVEKPSRWLSQILRAPFKAFRQPPPDDLYIVEADCDRPHEGAFLARLLKPTVTLWISVYRTHSMNFDSVVHAGRFATHEQAIAHEFGNFIAATTQLVVINGDQPELVNQLSRVPAGVDIKQVSLERVSNFVIDKGQTRYTLGDQTISLAGLHPKELGLSLQMVNELLDYLQLPLDPQYKNLAMPPGRSSVLLGKHDTTIIDSTYNTGLGAMTVMLKLFNEYPAEHKWLVLGDILEQGSLEAEEHEKLADLIQHITAERIILLGPRTQRHTYPILKKKLYKLPIDSFTSPKDVLDFIEQHLKGGETLFFKGARGLEGVIEQLLKDPADAKYLVRREASWRRRRQAWGLPR
jgi:UDP-N-acetylmuramoyl-tripeptide--D-alanyl-D-alanine ligase